MRSFIQTKQKILLISILIPAAFAVRCFFFTGGIRGSDAYAYALHAYDIASGQYDPKLIFFFYGFRYSVLLPTAASYISFGVNDLSSSFIPYLFSICNIALIFIIGERIFNWRIALIASILLIFYPLDIIYANVLSPDSVVPLLCSLVILCYLVAEQNSHRYGYQVAFLTLAGFFIALAMFARVTSIFLFAAIAIHKIMNRRIAGLLWISMGLVTPILVEAMYFYLCSGDPFLEIHRITSSEIALSFQRDFDISLLFYPKAMFGFDLTGLAFYGLTWWLVSGGLLCAFIRKDKNMFLLSLFLIVPFLGFEFGLQSLKEGIPIVKHYAYLSLISGPAILISAYFIQHITSHYVEFRTISVGILIVVISTIACMNLYGTYRLYVNIKNDAAPYEAVSNYIISNPSNTIYVHHFRWPLFLKYFLRYNPSLDFRTMDNLRQDEFENISHAYVIFHKRYLESDLRGRPFQQPPFYITFTNSPPKKWIKVLSFEGKPAYNNVTMYYAP